MSHKTLGAALVAAQAEMPKVEPDATNPHFRSRFVSLGHLVAKVRPVLNRHGLAFAQFPSCDDDGKPTLVTVLIHAESGERLEYAAPLILPKADPQGQGSAITYMRRYALAAALGIADQDDDDGNAGAAQTRNGGATQQTRRPGQPSDKQLEYLESLLRKAKLNRDQLRALLNVHGASEIAIEEGWMVRLNKQMCSDLIGTLTGDTVVEKVKQELNATEVPS